MAADPLRDLDALLGQERAAILAGAWARLAGIGSGKAACLAALEGDAANGRRAAFGADARLHPLAGSLRRNQSLLLAALDGLRDATLRGSALRAARAGFSTYDAQGGRAAVGVVPSRIERRA